MAIVMRGYARTPEGTIVAYGLAQWASPAPPTTVTAGDSVRQYRVLEMDEQPQPRGDVWWRRARKG